MGIAELPLNISFTRNHIFVQTRAFILLGIAELPLVRHFQGKYDVGYCWPPCDYSIHRESSLSSPGHFEQGQEYVEYCLPFLTLPSTSNPLFLVDGAKIMLIVASLPYTIPSIRIHFFLLQHAFIRTIDLLVVAGLLLNIPSHRNLCLLNDALN